MDKAFGRIRGTERKLTGRKWKGIFKGYCERRDTTRSAKGR